MENLVNLKLWLIKLHYVHLVSHFYWIMFVLLISANYSKINCECNYLVRPGLAAAREHIYISTSATSYLTGISPRPFSVISIQPIRQWVLNRNAAYNSIPERRCTPTQHILNIDIFNVFFIIFRISLRRM